MAGHLNWSRMQKRARSTEPAVPRKEKAPGPWSHIKREPVRQYTRAEIAALLAERKGKL